METQDQKLLKFHGIDIVKVDFSSDKKFEPDKNNMDINIDARVYYPKEKPNYFNIMMTVNIESEDCFLLIIHSIATFEFSEDINEGLKKNFINFNAPAIIFPYLRSFITSFTSSLGSSIPSITIPIRFFRGEMEEINFETTEKITKENL
ncbi:MAG: protein-export chaperone SecB [Melioribacteraceae bacterium]